ncbi:hypothetical protein MRX96_006423 [Rhipicephalus microplus]
MRQRKPTSPCHVSRRCAPASRLSPTSTASGHTTGGGLTPQRSANSETQPNGELYKDEGDDESGGGRQKGAAAKCQRCSETNGTASLRR